MTELWRIVFDTPKSETQRNDRLSTWTASNKSLLGWMSKDAQAMIATIVDGRGAAKGIDDGINRAEDALAKAFGTPVVDKGERQALKSFAHEAHSAGFTAAAYGADLDALMKKTVVMFTPGAKAALLSLRSTLADPSSTNVQRRDAFRAFQQQHPNLSASLSFGSMGKDLSVADWSDGRFAAAEQALKDAFSKAA